jgi:hypothetical protein
MLKEMKTGMGSCKADFVKPIVVEMDQLVKMIKSISARKAVKAPKVKMTDAEKKLKQEKSRATKAAAAAEVETEVNDEEIDIAKQAAKEAKDEAKAVIKAEKLAAKVILDEAKAAAKDEAKQAKEDAKAEAKQAKAEAKQAKEDAKATAKEDAAEAKTVAKQATDLAKWKADDAKAEKLAAKVISDEAKAVAKQAKADAKVAAIATDAISLIADAVTAEPKIARIPFPLPWNGEVVDTNCCGLRVNRGLYTQCKNLPVDATADTKLCSICTKDFNGTSTKYGTVTDRLAHDAVVPTTPYAELGNPKNVAKSFGDVLAKLGHEVEDVKATLAQTGIVLADSHYELTKKGRGRPSKTDVTAADHANMIEIEGHDLISKMIESANAADGVVEEEVDEEELVSDLTAANAMTGVTEVAWGGADTDGNQLLVDKSGTKYDVSTQEAIVFSDEVV